VKKGVLFRIKLFQSGYDYSGITVMTFRSKKLANEFARKISLTLTDEQFIEILVESE